MDDLSKQLRDDLVMPQCMVDQVDTITAAAISGGLGQAVRVAEQALDALDARWQTMESAPRDGRRVILLVPPYGAGSGHYDERAGKWVAHFTLYKEAQPTRWSPLPPPPEDV